MEYDAHVLQTHDLFRRAGFTLAAMEFPMGEREFDARCRFNGLPADKLHLAPVPWRYFPNAGMKAWWETKSDAEIEAIINGTWKREE